jgi:hypothetical protein
MERMEGNRFLIYPWDLSATGFWGLEGLNGLRDSDPERVAERLKGEGEDGGIEEIYIAAIAEYLSHGYPRKAAEVTRALAKIQPSIIDFVKNRFDDQLANKLLKMRLEDLPGKPAEFPRGSIEYVQ